ncbi:hypothetical protein VTJ49DRAFT_4163 [Mycothermus thermophilus]|uniref:Mis6 domain-containing protein n=1 Tax=Humicola insolens TaxID=85995 RepID=A0ABR3V6U5_HUMIN
MPHHDVDVDIPDADHTLDLPDDLAALIGDLEAASHIPAKRRTADIKPTVTAAAQLMYQHGVLPDELARLADLLTLRSHLAQASLAELVRNLYPAAHVADEVVLRFVGALGHGQLKPTLPLQAQYLRWLVMVYPVLENPSVLSQAYSVLFNLLDTAAIRIQTLLNLTRQTGGDPNLTGLLRVFKNYYPEIIVGDITKGRAASFKHPDSAWAQRLDDIQRQHAQRQVDTAVRNGFSVNHGVFQRLRGVKVVVPDVRTMHAQENSVTLEEIDSADSLVNKLEKIELPTQLVAVLADPLLQKLLLLRPDAEASSRISNWLMACLGDVAAGDADADIFLDMVDVIHEYALATKTLPPILVTFFEQFLSVWDGSSKRDKVLKTLSFVPLMEFQELHKILRALERAMLDNTPLSQLSLLRFYTSLLERWHITVQAAPSLDSLPLDSVTHVIEYVHPLSLTVTQTSPTVGAYLDVLDFYEALASLCSSPKLLPVLDISIPPPLLVYLTFFSPSLVITSRLCGILATYKRAWEAVMSPAVPRQLSVREREHINIFNGFLMDLCNCLWRGRAFATSDTNAKGCLLPASARAALEQYVTARDPDVLSLATAFDLSHSPLLCLRSISYLRELEDKAAADGGGGIRARHAGPVTQVSLGRLANRGGLRLSWQDYRAGVLAHLEEKGFPGIQELMYNTMKNLMRARQA